MIKRLISIIVLIVTLFTNTCAFAESYFPDSVVSDEVQVSLCNLSSIGTISSKGAAFQVDFGRNAVTEETYTLRWFIDAEEPISKQIKLTPGTQTVKTSFSVNNGIHQLNVKVYKNNALLCDFSQEIYVMDLYDYEFMQELSPRGVNLNGWATAPEYFSDLMAYGGYRMYRGGSSSWFRTENFKKVYDFSEYKKSKSLFEKRGMNPYTVTMQGNGKLYPSDSSVNPLSQDGAVVLNRMPQTQESLQGWSDYVLMTVKNDPDLRLTELWNEPDQFKKAGKRENAMAYNDLLKAASTKLYYEGYTDVALYSLCHVDNKGDFMPLAFEYGLYPYAEAMSHHAYVSMQHLAFMEDQAYESSLISIEDKLVNVGGWKDKAMSETGFTTPPANALYYTEPQAAKDIVKIFAMLDAYDYEASIIYSLVDTGTNPEYSEDCFGQVTKDGRIKGSYLTTTAFNIKTEGAVYVGELSFGDDTATKAYLYHKDGKPVVVAWTYRKDGSSVEWSLPGESVVIYDMYGNKTHTGEDKVILTDEPVYIENLSDKWYSEFAVDEITSESKKWKTDYSEIIGVDMMKEYEDIISEAISCVENEHTADDISKSLDKMKDYGVKLINLAKDGKAESVKSAAMTYQLYRIMERFSALYIVASKETNGILDIKRAEESSDKADKLYKNSMESMQYSDAILYYANKYAYKAEVVAGLDDNPNKAGVINAYSKMSSILCDWFDAFSSFENKVSLGYLIQIPYMEKKSYVNENVTLTVNANNYSKSNFRGKIKIFDDEGTLMAETKEFTQDGDGSFNGFKMTFKTKPAKDVSGYGRYFASYVDYKGNVLYTQPLDILVMDKFKVSSVACTKPVNEISSIPIKIENVTAMPQTAYITMSSDENFTFADTELEVELAANESKIIEVPVKEMKETKYHFYTFRYEVKDEYGSVITSNEEILNFTTIVKAEEDIDVTQWDGDISDWEDAYPIYINSPKNPSKKETWESAECSSRAFVKWNEDNLYILVDVYDDAFLQEFSSENMWQGDSLQISFDPLNDGSLLTNNGMTSSYKPDDYELGFSATAKGNEFWAWQSPDGLQGQTVDWFKMIHDYKQKITRYLIKLDRTVIATLDLSANATLGMNIVVNDADVLGRDGFYQFTLGTADKKNPDMYADFVLSTVESDEVVDGKATEIFPERINRN